MNQKILILLKLNEDLFIKGTSAVKTTLVPLSIYYFGA